jgi:hypothetical protein
LGDKLLGAAIGASYVKVANARIPGFVKHLERIVSNRRDGVVVLEVQAMAKIDISGSSECSQTEPKLCH